MASQNYQILRAAIAAAIAALLAIVFPLCILPFLPPLKPLAIQLLYRLRDVVAFLAFTTAIAIGIFSSQRKDAGRKKQSLEYHPLASIFGEPSYGEAEIYTEAADEGKKQKQQQQQQQQQKTMMKEGWDDEDGNAVDLSQGKPPAMLNSSLIKEKQQKAMAASRRRNLPASKEEGSLDVESKVASALQRQLHRRASSLDDSINYEPEPEGAAAGNSSSKRVSFSMDSSSAPSSSSSDHVSHGEKQNQTIQEDTIAMSSNELTRQADAFIAKFKEQMRMQRLESFQRFRRRVP